MKNLKNIHLVKILQNQEEINNMKRDQRLDFLRIVSMILVIIIHVANCYCRNFSNISNLSYFISVVFNAISRISVPIFFMISGSLLANKKYDKKKYLARIKKFSIILVIWTIIYLLWENLYLGKTNFNFTQLIFSPERAHLWYLYAIIAIYIAQPFASAIVNNISKEEKKLFVILWLLFYGVIYSLKTLFNLNIIYQIPIISGTYYLGYFIIGNFIYQMKDIKEYKKYNNKLIIIFVLSTLITILTTYFISIKTNRYYDAMFAYRSIFIMLSSISIFALALINDKKNSKIIDILPKYSLGIYLIHGIFLDIIKNIFNIYQIPSIIGIPLYTTIIFILSLLAIKIIKKIPLLGDYIC